MSFVAGDLIGGNLSGYRLASVTGFRFFYFTNDLFG